MEEVTRSLGTAANTSDTQHYYSKHRPDRWLPSIKPNSDLNQREFPAIVACLINWTNLTRGLSGYLHTQIVQISMASVAWRRLRLSQNELNKMADGGICLKIEAPWDFYWLFSRSNRTNHIAQFNFVTANGIS